MLMNNVAQQAGTISKLSDSQLSQELANPTGLAPSYLVMSEIQKRQSLRQGAGGSQTGPQPTIKQQMMAKAPAPDQTEAAGSMDGTATPQPAGPQEVPMGQGAGPGGILGLAQMSRVPNSAIKKPVGYDQSQPSAYAMGGPVLRFDGGGDVPAVQVVPMANAASTDMSSATPSIPVGRLPTSPGSYDFSKMVSDPGYYGVSPLDYLAAQQGMQQNILANQGIKTPQSLQSNYGSVYNDVLGGDKTFTSPYDPAIAAYKAQMTQGPSPTSMALMKAGAAMMAAPNGTLLQGLGAGLNTGADAYTQAQNAQRAIQDKMLQAQIAQGNALVGGKEHALAGAAAQQQVQGTMYNQAMQNANQMSGQALGLITKGRDAQDQSDALEARLASDQSIAAMGQAGANDRQLQNLTFQMPVNQKATYDSVYAATLKNEELAARASSRVPGMTAVNPATGGFAQPLSPETQAQIIQRATDKAHQAVQGYTKSALEALKLPSVVRRADGTLGPSPYLTSFPGN